MLLAGGEEPLANRAQGGGGGEKGNYPKNQKPGEAG